ncbi:META domain-containing protein [Arcticibacter sp.]|uniref:META domain-containing protein n=1 Tax=Arcticibacter sp. TaxID=1872630 RepID=UPI00388D317D
MKISSAIATIILGLFIFSACASRKPAPDSQSLTSQKWTLLSAGDLDAGSSGAFMELDTAPGEVRGKAGCNGFGGNYTSEGNKLQFGGLMGTKMACPALDVENAFFRALEATERYEIRKDSLFLYQGDKLLATLKATDK